MKTVTGTIWLRALLAVIVFCASLFGLLACKSQSGNTSQDNNDHQLEIINIGRLICGEHLPLAVVEKKYQVQLKTFRLRTLQNHDWNNVVTDMNSGKLAGSFILNKSVGSSRGGLRCWR